MEAQATAYSDPQQRHRTFEPDNQARFSGYNTQPALHSITLVRETDTSTNNNETNPSKRIYELAAVQLCEAKNHVYHRGWFHDQPVSNYADLIRRPSEDPERQRTLSGNLVYQYCDSNEASKWTNLQDWKDALSIGFNTFKEYAWSLLTLRDSFFITPWFRPEALATANQSVLPMKPGQFQHHGHAHISICLRGDDGLPLSITFDPATSSIGPYEAKTTPIHNRKADLILLSHGHMDHCRNIGEVTRPQKPLFSRIVTWIKTHVLLIHPTDDESTEHRKYSKLLIPAGTEKMLDHIQFLDKEGDVTKAYPYDPYKVRRNNSDVATIVPILSKHWSGTSPLNGHKAPALGYLVITKEQTVFFAGDTGYEEDMYKAVAQIASIYNTSVDHIFLPAGPDHQRHQMEKTHQATIDAISSRLHTQFLPTYQRLKAEWGPDDDPLLTDTIDIKNINHFRAKLTELLKQTHASFIHSGHYKLGNIHAEDPFLCMIDLISPCCDGKSAYLCSEEHFAHLSEVDARHEKEARSRVRSYMESSTYEACKQRVLYDLNSHISNSKAKLTLLLHQLLSQSPLGYLRSIDGSDNHGWVDALVEMVDEEAFDIRKLNLKTFSDWYKIPPDQRTESDLRTLFGLQQPTP